MISEDAASRAGVPFVNPSPWLCADGLCPVVVGSTIAYRDRGHISAARAGELWVPLGRRAGAARPGQARSSARRRRARPEPTRARARPRLATGAQTRGC